MRNSTIVALATPPGTGGLSVIRISGPRAFAIAAEVFGEPGLGADPVPRRAVYGILRRPTSESNADSRSGCLIDQAVALPFRAPHSYTGEDTVEFSCHGSPAVTRAALAACRMAGAEPAVAGEFTRRAFLNGKLSLDQAEAVADLIHAPSEWAARAAVRQVLGGLDDQLSAIEGPLLDLLSRIEGSLEFSADEDVAVPRATIRQELTAALKDLDRLLALAPAGRLLRDGIHVVLAGPPNVGKSSLFNALLSQERALVDDEPGTTRDVVTARVPRGGSVLVLHDTAGLREDPGRVEQMGIERTWREVHQADIVLDLAVAGQDALPLAVPAGARVIPVCTKADLAAGSDAPRSGGVLVSSVTGEGLPDLWQALDALVAEFELDQAVALGVVLNERHLHKLAACRSELELLRGEVDESAPGDEVVGSLLASILSGLGEVSGRVFTEHVLAGVFQRFCVGK